MKNAEQIDSRIYQDLVPAYGELDADEMVAEFRALHDAGDCDLEECLICRAEKSS